MSYFDMINFEENTLLEGKQAEEYLKKKSNTYARKQVSMDNKYATTAGGTHLSNSKYGKRAVDEYGRDKNTLSNDVTARHDPKFNTAREIEKHRNAYSHVMPGKSKSEKALDKARDKEYSMRNYANDLVEKERKNRSHSQGNKVTASMLDQDIGDEYDGYSRQIAHDAARRHYRRHVAKEMAELLEAYNPEYIEL